MRWRLPLAATLAIGLVVGGIVLTTTAHADTSVCDAYGQARTFSGYVAQNNRWGTDTPQCITVSGDGFTLSQSLANKPTNGAPASYPSVFWGCHYATCTSGFAPIQASSTAFGKVSTSVQFSYVDQGAYDASYDIWFDPTPRTDGQNTGAEVMIWLNHRGGVQPVGSKVATANIAGADWDVWYGNSGWNVISYVRSTPGTSLSTPVSAFYGDAVQRGYAQSWWYLTSVQAGFEPWVGGTGLAVTSFAVSSTASPVPVPTSTPTPTTTPTPTVTTPPTSTSPATTSAACRVNTRRDEWAGGFVRYVTVTNTGTSAIRGWSLSFQAGPGQQVTSGWSGTWRQVGQLVTATNLDWNATLAPGGSASLGAQGTWSGSDPEPTHWELNGVACATV